MNIRKKALILLAGILTACAAEPAADDGEVDAYASALVVSPPSDPLVLPAKTYVLPVILVPNEARLRAQVPDPDAASLDLNGDAIGSQELADYQDATQTFGTLLQVSRRKYLGMLRNPMNGLGRGTFSVASWNDGLSAAEAVPSYSAPLAPLVVESPYTSAQISSQQASGNYAFLTEVLDAAGCQRANCPFVLTTMVLGNPFAAENGSRFNHGFAAGGYVLANFEVLNEIEGSIICSTLLHELGHAFGLIHSEEFCSTALPHVCSERLSATEGPSVMSQNPDHWIFGCPGTGGGGPCSYPGHSAAENLPWILIPEDLRILGRNRAAFGFAFEKGLDGAETAVAEMRTTIDSYAISPSHPTHDATTTQTYGGSFLPNVLFGATGAPASQLFETYVPSTIDGDYMRSWHSSNVGQNQWATVSVTFPRYVDLTRARAFSGYGNNTHVMTGLRVRSASGLVLAEKSSTSANDEVSPQVGGTTFLIDVKAGSSGHVFLRELRFWSGGMELYPAAEPEVTQTSVGTYGGSAALVAGADQAVFPYSSTWAQLSSSSWHSNAVAPGGWVSMTVSFPEERAVSSVEVHTGHSSYYHRAREIQVQRSCLCGGSSSEPLTCTSASAANCLAAGGAGHFVFEFVKQVSSGSDQTISFGTTTGRVWKVAMRTPTAHEQPATPGYVVVRGLRFFDPSGGELFPPRYIHPGL